MSDPAVNAKPLTHEHIVIIGAGAAGLTAGIYTARGLIYRRLLSPGFNRAGR